MKTIWLCTALFLALGLAGCKSEDSVPTDAGHGTDLGRTDGGRLDLGSIDLGRTDLGASDLGSPDGDIALDLSIPPTDSATGDASTSGGDTCSDAIAITVGTHTAQTTVVHANDYDNGANCAAASGRDRVYTISVPNGQGLRVIATPAETFDVSVNLMLLSACTVSTSACVAGQDVGPEGDAERVHYFNDTGAAVDIAIIVDSFNDTDPGGTFDLTVALATPPATGDTCSMPRTITEDESTLVAETLSGFADQYDSEDSTGCTGMGGPDHVYAVQLIPTFELGVTVTPTGTAWDPSVNLIVGDAAACSEGAIVCAASSDIGEDGDSDTVTYTNSTGLPQTVFIIIDSYNGVTGGYTLSTSMHFPL